MVQLGARAVFLLQDAGLILIPGGVLNTETDSHGLLGNSFLHLVQGSLDSVKGVDVAHYLVKVMIAST